MRALLYTIIFLIVYGSLYPFSFELAAYNKTLLPPLFYFGLDITGRGDMVANILLFIPFGFLALHSFPGGNRAVRIVQILVVAFVLAYLIQAAQLVVPGRSPSGSDAVWNVLGCGIGCALGCLPLNRYLATITGPGGLPPIPLILGLLWLVYNWTPFVPSIDLQLLKNSLKMIISSHLDIWWLIQKIVMWLVIFHFLIETGSKLGREKFFPILVLVVLVGSLFIVGHATTIEHVAGGILSIPVWYMIRARRRAPLLAVLLGMAVLTTTFTPFELRNEVNSFHWIPFASALNSNLLLNVMSIFKKLIVYGSLIWLLVEAWFSLRTASLIVAAVLFVSEQFQVFFRGPSPEITDALLALAIGVTFHFYESARASEKWVPDNDENKFTSKSDTVMTGELEQAEGASHPELRELELNLHRYQATFLEQVANKLGWSQARVCAELAALKSGETQTDSALSKLTGMDFGLSIKRRDTKWVAVPIRFEISVIERLKALAVNSQKSPSHILRHLIDDHIAKLSSDVDLASILVARISPLIAFLKHFWRPIAGIIGAAVFFLLLPIFIGGSPSFQTSPAWASHDATVILDHHTHTRFSDGGLSPAALVELAVTNGCDALAITDHSDKGGSASLKQIKDIVALRRQYPDFLLFTGIELNMPSYGGREHVNVITVPEYESEILRKLGNLAEDHGKSAVDDEALLRAISRYRDLGIPLVTSYNHPSRKAAVVSESLDDILRWDPSGDIFTILAGSPGHQNAKVLGSYQAPLFTEDRWDPVAAVVGGVWDQLLGKGYPIWGAIATSDYHNKNLDKAPCSFSRTHLSVPSRTPQGVLQAVRAGTFWADHGHLLNRLTFSLEFEGLATPAYPGDAVNLRSDHANAVASVTLERGSGSEGSPLTLEMITNCSSGNAEVVHTSVLGPLSTDRTSLIPIRKAGEDGRSCFVRARIRMYLPTGPDLLAYTNPIRILL